MRCEHCGAPNSAVGNGTCRYCGTRGPLTPVAVAEAPAEEAEHFPETAWAPLPAPAPPTHPLGYRALASMLWRATADSSRHPAARVAHAVVAGCLIAFVWSAVACWAVMAYTLWSWHVRSGGRPSGWLLRRCAENPAVGFCVGAMTAAWLGMVLARIVVALV